MRRVTLLSAAVAGIAGLAIVAWWWTATRIGGPSESGRSSRSGVIEAVSVGVHEEPGRPREITDPSSTESSSAPIATASDKKRRLESVLRVVLADGSPAVGAEASWTPLDPLWNPGCEPRTPEDLEQLAQRTQSAHADERGGIDFPQNLGSDAQGSVLWITLAGSQARWFRLPQGASPSTIESPVQLEPADAIQVRVVDALDRPVEGARIFSVRAWPREGEAPEPQEEREARRHVIRTQLTDASGQAVVAALAGTQRITAYQDGLRSTPWFGREPGQVELELRSTFVLGGSVVPDGDPHDLTQLRVSIYAHIDGRFARLAQTAVDDDGRFGPIELPAVVPFEGEAELEGGNFVKESVRLTGLAAGDVHHIEFRPRLGVGLPVLVVNSQEAPISGAQVEFIWQSGDTWTRSRITSDREGLALLPGGPLGSLWIEVAAEGFISRRENEIVTAPWSEPLRLRLERGGTVTGVVRLAGAPVGEFVIGYWAGQLANRAWKSFVDRRDGSFVLTGVPPGEVSLLALSTKSGSSKVVQVTVSATDPANSKVEPDPQIAAGTSAEVHLDLDGCAVVVGTVVDALTGDPVGGATVQPWFTHELWDLATFGAPAVTDTNGAFTIDCAVPGPNGLEVRAPGFAVQRADPHAKPGERVEIAPIRLVRGADLELQLELEAGVDPEGYMGAVTGVEHREPVSFPANGLLRFEGLRPGKWTYSVLDPEGGARYGDVHLDSVHPTRVVVHPGAGPFVEVEIVEREGHSLVDDAYLYVTALGASNAEEDPIQARWVPPSRRVHCRIAPGTAYDLVVQDGDGRYVASARVPPQTPPVERIRIETGEEYARVQVIDDKGTPMAGVELYLDSGVGYGARRAETDSQGYAGFGPWPHPKANLLLSRTDVGVGYIRDLTLDERKPTRLEFAPRGWLELVVADGDTRLAGLDVRLVAPISAEHFLTSRQSDATGEVRFAAVLPGAYGLRITGGTVWPTRAEVQVETGGTQARVEVRRRGGLEFQGVRGGAARSGMSVVLRSLEFETDAREWADAGRIVVQPPDLRAGLDGRLRFDGLPRGEYSWSATEVSGATRQGRIQVPAGTRQVVRVVFED